MSCIMAGPKGEGRWPLSLHCTGTRVSRLLEGEEGGGGVIGEYFPHEPPWKGMLRELHSETCDIWSMWSPLKQA